MENQIWYDVSGTPTKLTDIKYGSFHYHADMGMSGKIRLGNVFSAYIEFDYLVSNGVTLNYGDALQYKQLYPGIDNTFAESESDLVWDGGTFYITEIKYNQGVCHITAFDAVIKLDVDFSARLKTLESSFPLTIQQIITEIETVSGVTIDTSDVLHPSSANPPLAFFDGEVSYFWSAGITCREVIKAIAELCGENVKATRSDGATVMFSRGFGGDRSNPPWLDETLYTRYIICPDDGSYTPPHGVPTWYNVWYKENGLTVGDVISPYDALRIYGKDGALMIEEPLTQSQQTTDNVYNFYLSNNVLTNSGITWSGYWKLKDYLRLAVRAIDPSWISGTAIYYACEARLFPFRNPYCGAKQARFIDADGGNKRIPIMSIDLSETEVVLKAYSDKTVGAETETGASSANSELIVLQSQVINLAARVDNIGIQIDEILDERSIPQTATAYDCDWYHYDALVICAMFYTNVMATIFIPTSYFRASGSTLRPIVYDPVNSRRYDVYKVDNDSVYLVGFSTPGAAYGVRIYGVSSRKDIASVEYLTTADGDYLTTVDGDYLTL